MADSSVARPSVRFLSLIKTPGPCQAVDGLLEQSHVLNGIALALRLFQQLGSLSAKGFGIQDARTPAVGGSKDAPTNRQEISLPVIQ
jgi:hypothetical protein